MVVLPWLTGAAGTRSPQRSSAPLFAQEGVPLARPIGLRQRASEASDFARFVEAGQLGRCRDRSRISGEARSMTG